MYEDERNSDPPQQGTLALGLVKESTHKCLTKLSGVSGKSSNLSVGSSKGLTRLLSMEHTPWTGSADLPNLAAPARTRHGGCDVQAAAKDQVDDSDAPSNTAVAIFSFQTLLILKFGVLGLRIGQLSWDETHTCLSSGGDDLPMAPFLP